MLIRLAVLRAAALALLFALHFAHGPAMAQLAGPGRLAQNAPAPAAEAPPAATPPASTQPVETVRVRNRFDELKGRIDEHEEALQRETISDQELVALRQAVDATVGDVRTLIDELTPRLDAARARLRELGPKPASGAPAESADVAQERSERENAVAELDETQRLGRTLLVQAQQTLTSITDRRRAAFARELFRESRSIASPEFWMELVRITPSEVSTLNAAVSSWIERAIQRSNPVNVTYLVLAVLAAGLMFYIRRLIAHHLVARDPAVHKTTRRSQIFAAVGALAAGAVPAAMASLLIHLALDGGNFLPPRARPVAVAVLVGFAFVMFARSLADAFLAPGRDAWRLVTLPDTSARRLAGSITAIAVITTFGKIIETLNQAVGTSLPVTVATRGIVTLVVAGILAAVLRGFAVSTSEEEACLGPYIPTQTPFSGPVRLLGWTAVTVLTGSVLVGYVAFGSFLVDQIVWVTTILALLYLSTNAVAELIADVLRNETRISTTLQANTGLRRKSLQQIGVLVDGVARVVLILAATMLVLAPWGVESVDLFSSIRAAYFGFTVGDLTISFSTIIIGLLLFATGFTVTKIVQRWLERSFLPATELDAGLRNSIATVVGYIGFFAAAAFSLSYLGLGLEKIAIVAGALSVGIGFGLQSIVSNFVSGLILLWERPIRVGDLVVVGDGEGFVRRINVRATEIETFDRSTVIVPNSNLISGTVRNRVRGDRTGRVVIPVKVLRNQDPERAAAILKACAAEHPDVLPAPGPQVFFRLIGDTFLEFDLIAFVIDVERQTRVLSDLNFAVFRRLNEEGVIPPMGPPSLSVLGLGNVETALEHIAGAIGEAGEAKGPGHERGKTPDQGRDDAGDSANSEPVHPAPRKAGANAP